MAGAALRNFPDGGFDILFGQQEIAPQAFCLGQIAQGARIFSRTALAQFYGLAQIGNLLRHARQFTRGLPPAPVKIEQGAPILGLRRRRIRHAAQATDQVLVLPVILQHPGDVIDGTGRQLQGQGICLICRQGVCCQTEH